MYKILTRQCYTQTLTLALGDEEVSDIITYANVCLRRHMFVHHSGIVGFRFA